MSFTLIRKVLYVNRELSFEVSLIELGWDLNGVN